MKSVVSAFVELKMDSFRLEHPPGNEDWVLSFDFSTLCIFNMDSLRLKYPAGKEKRRKKHPPGLVLSLQQSGEGGLCFLTISLTSVKSSI